MIQERQQMILCQDNMFRVDFFQLFHEGSDPDLDPYPLVPDELANQTVERRIMSVHINNIFEETVLHIV